MANYIKTAQAALFIKGVDISIENPRLNNVLGRLSARLRKFGNLTNKSKKNTDDDKKPVVLWSTIKQGFVHELTKYKQMDWVTELNTVRTVSDVFELEIPRDLITAFVMNAVGLIGGLRKSDISKTRVVAIDQSKLKLKVVNWKLTQPSVKLKRAISEDDLDHSRQRELTVNSMEKAADCPYIWIRALWSLNPRKQIGKFLFQSKGKGARKTAWSNITTELKLKRIPLKHSYTHRFRVSHASLARSAGFPDSEILAMVDWGHPSLIDRYERYLPAKKYVDSYLEGLGFGSGF